MNRFAALIDALLFTPGRNGKLRLMQEYFRATPDPERGWALAALTGALSFAEAKPSQVRDLAISRVDPELFGWSLDFVGDLAETVALIWPEPSPRPHSPPPFPRKQGREFTVPAIHPPSQAGRARRGRERVRRGCGRGRAHPDRDRRDARHREPRRCRGISRAVARRPRRHRPLGLIEARYRQPADRCFGAARQAGARRMERGRDRPDRGGLAWPKATLPDPLRLARRPRRGTADRRIGEFLPADAGPAARRSRSRPTRPARLSRRMEMGRHPGPARRARRRQAALFALG